MLLIRVWVRLTLRGPGACNFGSVVGRAKQTWRFLKNRGTFLGVPIRTIVFWGLYWGLPILRNYHMPRVFRTDVGSLPLYFSQVRGGYAHQIMGLLQEKPPRGEASQTLQALLFRGQWRMDGFCRGRLGLRLQICAPNV